MLVICKYYFSFCEELEHPQIFVFLGGPGTNSSQIPRKKTVLTCMLKIITVFPLEHFRVP